MSRHKEYIAITAAASVSPLGVHGEGTGKHWFDGKTRINLKTYLSQPVFTAAVPEEIEEKITEIQHEKRAFQHLDRTVLLALLAAKQLKHTINNKTHQHIGVNIGSSRGATSLFEQSHSKFLSSGGLKTSAYTSPVTTLGNISSWVMQYLGLNGPILSHSITCSTALQAMLNGIAWLKAGMADSFIVGGAEAPLTPFTIAQMKSMNIYSGKPDVLFPCTPLGFDQNNGMVLGEGASLFLLEKLTEKELAQKDVLAVVNGWGYGHESIHSLTEISPDGTHFQRSMKMAVKNIAPPDIVLLHAPGTAKGDESELNAVRAVFGRTPPFLYSNKWQIGHTLGASAALNMQNALDVLRYGTYPRFPYKVRYTTNIPEPPIRSIMINAAGFGGNAGSLAIERV